LETLIGERFGLKTRGEEIKCVPPRSPILLTTGLYGITTRTATTTAPASATITLTAGLTTGMFDVMYRQVVETHREGAALLGGDRAKLSLPSCSLLSIIGRRLWRQYSWRVAGSAKPTRMGLVGGARRS